MRAASRSGGGPGRRKRDFRSATVKDSKANYTVYSPDDRIKFRLFQPIRALIREIVERRWHIWIEFKRDFSAAHSGAGLGWIWNFILPVVPIAAYATLAALGRFPSAGEIPRAPYIACGVTLWMLFTQLITAPMQRVNARRSIVGKTSYPMIGLLVACFGQTVFDTLVRVVALAIVVGVFFGAPPLQGVLALPALLPAILFFLSIGMMFSILSVIFTDLKELTAVTFTYGIFFSNVIFPLGSFSGFGWVLYLNPFAVYVDNIRALLLLGELHNPVIYAVYCGISILLFITASRIFYTMEKRILGYT